MNDSETKNSKRRFHFGGIGIGIAIGAAIGAATDNLGIGIAIGTALGAALEWGVGTTLSDKTNTDEK
jgi:hypothetical protein